MMFGVEIPQQQTNNDESNQAEDVVPPRRSERLLDHYIFFRFRHLSLVK